MATTAGSLPYLSSVDTNRHDSCNVGAGMWGCRPLSYIKRCGVEEKLHYVGFLLAKGEESLSHTRSAGEH
jgi:hypothetical protein